MNFTIIITPWKNFISLRRFLNFDHQILIVSNHMINGVYSLFVINYAIIWEITTSTVCRFFVIPITQGGISYFAKNGNSCDQVDFLMSSNSGLWEKIPLHRKQAFEFSCHFLQWLRKSKKGSKSKFGFEIKKIIFKLFKKVQTLNLKANFSRQAQSAG